MGSTFGQPVKPELGDECTPDNSWRCAYTGPQLGEADATVALEAITSWMLHDGQKTLTDYERTCAMDLLKCGFPTTAVIASLATGETFQRQVWQIAVGAAFDYCATLLGLAGTENYDSLKRRMICDYAANATAANLSGPINLGWMVASLAAENPTFVTQDPHCSYIPPSIPAPDDSLPCPKL